MKKLISIVLLIIFIFNGCVTKTMWGERENSIEQVNIKEFLYSKEKKLIVFLSEKYHFIFDGDELDTKNYDLMMSMLTLKQNERSGIKINEDLSEIHVINSNDIFCKIHLDLDHKILDENQIKLYEKLGFIDYHDPFDKSKITIVLKINGKIYKVRESFKRYTKSLNNQYKINMLMKVDTDTNMQRYGKMALTPLTLAADTVLTVAGVGAGIGITALGISTANVDGLEAGFKVMFKTVELQSVGLIEFLDKAKKVNIK